MPPTPPRKANSGPTPPPSRATPASAWWLGWLGLAALCVLAYYPAIHGGFLWDDNAHVTKAELQPAAGLGRIWFELGATQQYYPVLHSAFWLEHRLWGDAAAGYHWLNLLLHATSAALLVRVLQRLAIRGAWLAGLVFALHPVCVESVAWISEQKNTLSLLFYLLAVLAYLRFDAQRADTPPASPGTASAHAWRYYLLATAQLETAVRLKPELWQAECNLANTLLSIPGRQEEAIAHYKTVLRRRPELAEIQMNLGIALLSPPGWENDAIAHLESALRTSPDLWQAHFALANTLLNLPGRRREAIPHLEAVLRLNPNYTPARQLLEQLRP